MRTGHAQVWAPPESAVRIEYTNEILRDAARFEAGVLYGTHRDSVIRLAAVRREQPLAGDSRLAGLAVVGTFAVRPRGEVFLTDLNLQHLEQSGGSVGLVIAGTRAGFFVYEPGGAIQTIKSYLEFEVPDIRPAQARKGSRKWITAVAIAIAGIALSAWTPVRTRLHPRPAPLQLAVRDDHGQLLISWNRTNFAGIGRIEINDGPQRDWIPVTSEMTSATYVPQSPEIEVKLIAGSQSETARVFESDPSAVARAELAREIGQLESEADALRAELQNGRDRIGQIEKRISRHLK